MASKESFIYQTGYFSKFFNVHAIDLKGFGDNGGMGYPYSLDDYVKEVKEYVTLNCKTRPHVIAHSFGARIVIKLAAENPELFDRIVLTGAAGLKPKRTLKYYVKRCVFKIVKPFLNGKKPRCFYSSDYLSLNPVMQRSFSLIVNEYLDSYAGKIENPTLIIFGSKDRETPPYMARQLNKKIKNSKMLIFEGAGHFCFIDSPEKFNWEVREFLLSKY